MALPLQSLPTASFGTIANWLLLASLIGGVLSAFVIVKASDVEEEHWAEDPSKSSERIAELTTQGDELRKGIAEANEGTAKANAKAAQANQKAEEERLARVKLETRIAPRHIPQEQQNELTARLKDLKVRETTLVASPATAENEWLVRQLGAPA